MATLSDTISLQTELEGMIRDATQSIGRSPCRHAKIGISVLSQEDAGSYALLPDEAKLFSSRFSERKKGQFAAGRAAGRIALEQAGLGTPLPIPRGAGGEPLWPAGFAGSITHCYPWSVAVAFSCANLCTIGIDLESTVRTEREDISSVICTDPELRWVKRNPRLGERVTMLFSAKEAVYKAFYGSCRRYIDFKEVTLCWFPEGNRFLGRFLNNRGDDSLPRNWFEVHWRRYRKWVFSAVIVAGVEPVSN